MRCTTACGTSIRGRASRHSPHRVAPHSRRREWRSAGLMTTKRPTWNGHARAGDPCSPSEVDVFEIREVIVIECADREESVAAGDHVAAASEKNLFARSNPEAGNQVLHEDWLKSNPLCFGCIKAAGYPFPLRYSAPLPQLQERRHTRFGVSEYRTKSLVRSIITAWQRCGRQAPRANPPCRRHRWPRRFRREFACKKSGRKYQKERNGAHAFRQG